jgi:poly(hydroxyalkanoate) depolymerase family esterase
MLKLLQRWLARLFKRSKHGLLRAVRPRFRRAGRWVEGSQREARGTLAFAPMIAPHRPYRLYLPAGYRASESLPMLIMLHGCHQDAESFAAGTRMNSLADRERLLVLYPEQRLLANHSHCWNWFDPATHKGGGEAAIIAAMVSAVAARYGVDSTRIWVAGLSAGAAMASTVASCYANLFAACAVHSGLMFQAATSPAAATRAMERGSDRDPTKVGREAFELSANKVDGMPVIVIHGARDERVNPINADQVVLQFAAMNQLAAPVGGGAVESMQAEMKSATSAGGYRYEISDYRRGAQLLIRKVIVDELGHAWSGGDSRFPYNDPRGPDASELIWNFFRQHRRTLKLPGIVNAAEAQSV